MYPKSASITLVIVGGSPEVEKIMHLTHPQTAISPCTQPDPAMGRNITEYRAIQFTDFYLVRNLAAYDNTRVDFY
ncbi:hypothetical protein H6S82_15775 [Planktothrix sp. FACHB-1355]|uniref:Uncharacterized protein n=1 Tax=Aerosakkonema funiforme FACHB-1375 TaxID=2949571 RepID=A0A926VE95_9CYAN|nr:MULTISPECIES: hypothetical protein [Oscillatoriales]MBD2181995.1 hypothetical protein [Aerosakkonema funiforme FACHB-1375]MBD3560300.1 hypothetical protein [Planktothrix sp. FACHB-1355]